MRGGLFWRLWSPSVFHDGVRVSRAHFLPLRSHHYENLVWSDWSRASLAEQAVLAEPHGGSGRPTGRIVPTDNPLDVLSYYVPRRLTCTRYCPPTLK